MIAIYPLFYFVSYFLTLGDVLAGDLVVLTGKDFPYQLEVDTRKWQVIESNFFEEHDYFLKGEKGRIRAEIASDSVPRTVEFLADEFVNRFTLPEQQVEIKKIKPIQTAQMDMTLVEFELKKFGVTQVVFGYYKTDPDRTLTCYVIVQKEYLERYKEDIDNLANQIKYASVS